MKNFFRQYAAEFWVTLLGFAICLLVFRPVTDDYTSFGSNCASGQFSNYPFCEYGWWGLIGIGSIYRLIYKHFPTYDWLSVSFIAYEFCCLYLLLRAIKIVIMKNIWDIFFVRMVQIIFVCFFIENIVFISHTRSSLLFCGISLVTLLFSKKVSPKGTIIYSIIFIFGMLLRPESSIGLIVLVSVGYLIHRFDLLFIFQRCFLPIAATCILLIVCFIDWSHTDLFLKKVDPEVEYKLMEKRLVDISTMKNAVDSIKYQAVAAGTCFDTRILTPDYFRSLLLPGANLTFGHAYSRLLHVLSFYRYYLFISAYSISILLLTFFWFGLGVRFFKIALFLFFSFFVIYLLDYTGGIVCGRHFLNLQLISLLVISFYFFDDIKQPNIAVRNIWLSSVGCLLIVFFCVIISVVKIKNNSDGIYYEISCYEATMQALDKTYSNRIIILTTDDFHIFDHVFSIKNKKYTRNTYLMYDVWTHWLFPDYVEYLGRQCNCDPLNPIVFFKWLSDQKALYIAAPWRYDLTMKYMYLVHGQNIEFVPDRQYKKPHCLSGLNIENFELRTITVKQ